MSSIINATLSNGLSTSADNSGEIELQSNGTTALKVNTNEGIQILNCLGVGNATPSTSGAGITFPATQSASTDANTLDDYEEGTWSPSVGGTATYTAQRGSYTKIGRQVTAIFDIVISVIGTGSTSQISGLPFASAGVGSPQGITAPISYWENLNVSAFWMAWRLDENQTTLFNAYTTAAGAVPSVNGAILKSGTRIIGTVTYFV